MEQIDRRQAKGEEAGTGAILAVLLLPALLERFGWHADGSVEPQAAQPDMAIYASDAPFPAVSVEIAHDEPDFLVVELRSPQGTVVRLHDRSTGTGGGLVVRYDLQRLDDGEVVGAHQQRGGMNAPERLRLSAVSRELNTSAV